MKFLVLLAHSTCPGYEDPRRQLVLLLLVFSISPSSRFLKLNVAPADPVSMPGSYKWLLHKLKAQHAGKTGQPEIIGSESIL